VRLDLEMRGYRVVPIRYDKIWKNKSSPLRCVRHGSNYIWIEIMENGLTIGSIVRCRDREWVVLPSADPELAMLRPLTAVRVKYVAFTCHLQTWD